MLPVCMRGVLCVSYIWCACDGWHVHVRLPLLLYFVLNCEGHLSTLQSLPMFQREGYMSFLYHLVIDHVNDDSCVILLSAV